MAKKNSEQATGVTEEQAAAESAESVAATVPSECEVDAIIRKRVYAAVGVGFVPVPLVDLAGLTAIQLELIHALSKAYGVEFKKERVKSILSSLCGGALTVVSVPLLASVFKSIPIIGTTTGAATISITGGATTYAIGWVFDRHFRKGGSLSSFNAEEAKGYFKTKLQEGKDLVSRMNPKRKTDAEEKVVDADSAPA